MTEPTSPTTEPQPERVGNYVFETVLGRGATAVVWRAHHRILGTKHAIKVLERKSKGIRERAIQEARIQARLRHPNVVRVVDVVPVDGKLGLVAELVEGPTVGDWLFDHSPPVGEVVRVFRAIVEGVAAAHAQGIIHRDLKPENVLIDLSVEPPEPRVTDFGLARIHGDSEDKRTTHTQEGAFLGTPAYMAPEQFEDARSVDARADVFALGCILYSMLFRTLPFPTHDIMATAGAILGGRYVRPTALWPEIPPNLSELIERSLEPDRDHRLADCAALLALLDATDMGPEQAQVSHHSLDGSDGQGGTPTYYDDATPPTSAHQAAETLLPGTGRAQPTLAPPGAGETLVPVPGPGIVVVAPPSGPYPAVAGEPSMVPTSKPGVPVPAVAGLVAAVAVTVGGIAWWTQAAPTEPPAAETVSVAAPVNPEPAPTQPVEAAPAPAEAPTEATPQPTKPAPTKKAATPPDSKPATESAKPKPTTPPKPEAPAATATVRVQGGVTVELRSAGGVERPGKVPPGSYAVYATFSGGTPVHAGDIVVQAGQEVTLRCVEEFGQCGIR